MKIDDINMDEWEIVPEQVPEHETPRQFMRRLTDLDLEFLDMHTWDEVVTHQPLHDYFLELIMRNGKPPRMMLRRKEQKQEE